MHPVLKKLADCGQSIWYDNVRRGMLDGGDMQALVDDGVVGVTSNPTIFMKAVTESDDYDEQIRRMASGGHDAPAIYDALTIEDIGRTADLFLPVYERTDRRDGFVSIEVSPKLAYDTQRTLAEAQRIYRALDRPNVMIKIPGTAEGLPAIEDALADGININVTLIFSADVYEDIMKAYLGGLQRYADAGNDPSRVASVASFFVSRVDSAIDPILAKHADGQQLLGKAAIANSKIAYARFRELFAGPRWEKLAASGAVVQRPLWASTSAKNPSYPDTLYVDNLIGEHTVNTLPPARAVDRMPAR